MNEQLYSIDYLVDRLYTELNEKASTNKKMILDKPIVKAKDKKTIFLNFTSTCNKLNRPVQDVKLYFEKEMNVISNLNSQGSLIIVGIFRENHIMKVLSSYINDFVKCKECGNCDTEIVKEDRITYNRCMICKSKKALI
ncbi:MAG: translation initiation factor 2 subunit beta [Barrevirus sp.]|uniref:Translation initiation factor 2 subunit beta n=1 Tax=Barrevirus sp. TaxID=2487763 RepID=A0A3G4ZQ40_9VIRU|nr:MAG: translation initiation factor 2 subunit beta [Barrevirus sp.]